MCIRDRAPGAIESPAEFPPLGAAPKKGKQQPGRKQNRKERPVPSNSIRDLSSKQAKKEEEAKPLDEEVTSGEGESTAKSHEMSSFLIHVTYVYADEQVGHESQSEAISGTDSEPEVQIVNRCLRIHVHVHVHVHVHLYAMPA